MAALTADARVVSRGYAAKAMVPAQADTFYGGALVFAVDTAANGIATVAPAAGDYFLGIATHQQTIATAGDPVEIYVAGYFGFPVSGTTYASDMGRWLCVDASAITDNPADLKTSDDLTLADNDILLGQITSVFDSLAFAYLGGLYPLYVASTTNAFVWTGRT